MRAMASSTKSLQLQVYLHKNEVTTWDSYINSFVPSSEHSFFNVARYIQGDRNPRVFKGSVLYLRYIIDPIKLIHEREMYSFLNLFEDLGGIIEIIMITFGAICFPISEFSFNLDAARANQPKTNLVHYGYSFMKSFRSKVKLFYSLRWPKLSRLLKLEVKDQVEIYQRTEEMVTEHLSFKIKDKPLSQDMNSSLAVTPATERGREENRMQKDQGIQNSS